MRRRSRLLLFAISALVLLPLFAWSMCDLPQFGYYRGPYGDLLNSITVYERHTTNVVTAVNFDFRAVDTLGEESILFMAVIGVALLLRRTAGEDRDRDDSSKENEESDAPPPSDAVKVATMGLVGPLVVFGLYIVLHGQVTPGGGFQGGVILATAPLLVYLAGDLQTFKKITSHAAVEFGEALGIGAFAGVGFLGLFIANAFLRNVWPLGTTGSVISSGTILALNLCSALAVSGGFVSAIYSFLEQTLEMRMEGDKGHR